MKIRESVKELVTLAAMMDGQTCKTDPETAVENAWALVQAGEAFLTGIDDAAAAAVLAKYVDQRKDI